MTILFSNKQNMIGFKFREMIDKYENFRNDIDDYQLLSEIKYQIGRDYYKDAKLWLDVFKDAEWWKEDLK